MYVASFLYYFISQKVLKKPEIVVGERVTAVLDQHLSYLLQKALKAHVWHVFNYVCSVFIPNGSKTHKGSGQPEWVAHSYCT